MDLMFLSKTPACSLRICRALFSSLLAANLHTVLANTLGILFATDLCSFLKALVKLDLASKSFRKLPCNPFKYMSFSAGLGCAKTYLGFPSRHNYMI